MMTVDQMIEVLTAYKAGKKIQMFWQGSWGDCGPHEPAWNFKDFIYRVKPEPKVIWVNEYADGSGMTHPSKEQAQYVQHGGHVRVAVRYVECPEGDAS